MKDKITNLAGENDGTKFITSRFDKIFYMKHKNATNKGTTKKN